MPEEMLKEILASAQNFKATLSEIYQQGRTDGGVTLRDRFAMVALPALMAEFFAKGMSLHDVGAAAYDIADGMLQARDIRRNSGNSD